MGIFSLGKVITNLSAVTATGAGNAIDCQKNIGSTWVVTASNVTTGGTVKIQGKSSESATVWYDVASIAISADGAKVQIINEPHAFLRANVTARTDGTYTVECRRWVGRR